MKSIPNLWETLNKLNHKEDVCDDVKEEVTLILSSLKPVDKPNPVRLEVKGSNEIFCEWDRIDLKNKFQVKYLLFKGEDIVSFEFDLLVLVCSCFFSNNKRQRMCLQWRRDFIFSQKFETIH
jgi:hypothetical protein